MTPQLVLRCFRCALAGLAAFPAIAPAQEPAPPPPNAAPTLSLRSLLIDPARRRPIALGKKRALVVGVGQATAAGVTQTALPVCRLDATAMGRVLGDLGFECRVLIDTPTDPPVDPRSSAPAPKDYPNVTNVLAAISDLLDAAGPDDTVLIYMSSHGGMLGKDAKVLLTDGALPIRTMKELMGKSKALVRVLMLDCCRDEAGRGEASAPGGIAASRPEVTEVRDVHTISACAPDELSQIGANGLSIFTECFVDGVVDCRADRVRDGVIELDEIIQYVAAEVPERARKQRNASQHATRTIVDPRAINPVLGVCDQKLASVPRETTALAGPRVTIARHDWIYSSLMLQKAHAGMSREEVEKAMHGVATLPAGGLTLDKDGNGEVMYVDEPQAGDALQVVFEGGKVSRVNTVFANICEGEYDPGASRSAVLKLLNGETIAELDALLVGKTVADVIKQIGCPAASLVGSGGGGDGSLRYPDVPRPTQMLVVNLIGGHVGTTEVRILTP